MNAEALYNLTLSEVANITKLTPAQITKGRTEECVDARFILVMYLSQKLNGSIIAKMVGVTSQAVSQLKARDRFKKFLVSTNYKALCKALERHFL